MYIKNTNYKLEWFHQPEERLTTCYLYDTNTKEVINTSHSSLHSNDTYDKEKGRQITLRRVLETSSIPRKEWSIFWEAYKKRKPTKAQKLDMEIARRKAKLANT